MRTHLFRLLPFLPLSRRDPVTEMARPLPFPPTHILRGSQSHTGQLRGRCPRNGGELLSRGFRSPTPENPQSAAFGSRRRGIPQIRLIARQGSSINRPKRPLTPSPARHTTAPLHRTLRLFYQTRLRSRAATERFEVTASTYRITLGSLVGGELLEYALHLGIFRQSSSCAVFP
jgi:hypothetical protein